MSRVFGCDLKQLGVPQGRGRGKTTPGEGAGATAEPGSRLHPLWPTGPMVLAAFGQISGAQQSYREVELRQFMV